MYEAFGSPMLGSTVTAPRRDGDGMDKESLLRESVTPTAPAKHRHHVNLNSTAALKTVDKDKVKAQKVIPHEPVKGAVKAVEPSGGTKMLTVPMPKDPTPIPGLPGKITAAEKDAREVEGQGHRTAPQEVERLNRSMSDLQNQLDVQAKINTDLKKMLVASMGDDLHHKVDTLVRTKAQLATDIGGYTDRICEDHETLDRLLIQADLWRTKYNASRVLVTQLTSDKESLVQNVVDSRRALQQLVQERQQLWDSLLHTHRYLRVLQDAFNPARRPPPTVVPNILELARTNHLLADSVKFRLLPAMPVFPAALDAGIYNGASPAEKLAYQVLQEASPDPTVTPSVAGYRPDKFARFHPQVRFENITFNCCGRCKGEVQVV